MKIRNWKRFQHFRDRKPKWIKLYRDLLNDISWHCLSDKDSKILVGLWLLAAEHEDGELPDVKTIAFRLRASESETKQSLANLSSWVEGVDTKLITQKYQSDALELETEIETEVEIETETERQLLVIQENRDLIIANEKIKKSLPSPVGEQRRGRPKKIPDEDIETPNEVWEAYSAAYQARYFAPPLRNAKANSMLKRFRVLVPASEAAEIAAFYVRHNSSWYVQRMHPLEFLVSDATKLRTEWITGARMTATRAVQIDRTQSMLDVVADIEAERVVGHE